MRAKAFTFQELAELRQLMPEPEPEPKNTYGIPFEVGDPVIVQKAGDWIDGLSGIVHRIQSEEKVIILSGRTKYMASPKLLKKI